MSRILSRWSELDEETRDGVRWLLFVTAMAYWRPVKMVGAGIGLTYDPRLNVLTVIDYYEGAAQFRLDEPHPQYRWN